MISLHKIIEQAKNDKKFCMSGGYASKLKKKYAEKITESIWWDLMAVRAKSAVCFDLGRAESYIGLGNYTVVRNLPFKKCWFELSNNITESQHQYKIGLLIEKLFVDGREITTGGFFSNLPVKGNEKKEWLLHQDFHSEDNDIFFKYRYTNKAINNTINNELCGLLVLINIFLQARSCNNVISVQNNPPEKLNKKRIKNGKVPLFSYWTLNLDFGKSVTRGESQGGTHASPRVHLRRGHAREYMPGKFTWVQPCVVGNKEKGVVMKDYKVSGLSGAGGGAG